MTTDLTAFGPWAYLVLAAIAIVPLLPSEIAAVSAGVLAAGGHLDLWLVIAAAGTGALAGDLATYGGGRLCGGRRVLPGKRPGVADRFGGWDTLRRFHGAPIVVARLVPGGRTVLAVAAGATRLDVRYFAVRTGVGCLLWAAGNGMVGYLTGTVVDGRVQGLLVGIVFAIVLVAAAAVTSSGPARGPRGRGPRGRGLRGRGLRGRGPREVRHG